MLVISGYEIYVAQITTAQIMYGFVMFAVYITRWKYSLITYQPKIDLNIFLSEHKI